MKKSQEIILSDQQNLPPNRREVMKKGLGLTLGSGALGLAGLGASTSAQSIDWFPGDINRQITVDKNSIIYPLYDKYKNYFDKYFLKGKQPSQMSASVTYHKTYGDYNVTFLVTLVVRGTYISSTYVLAQGLYTPKSGYLITDDELSFTSRYEVVSSGVNRTKFNFPSGDEALRRRLQSNNPIPYEGEVGSIYGAWVNSGRTTSDIPLQQNFFVGTGAGVAAYRTFNITQIREDITIGSNDAVTMRTFTFRVFPASPTRWEAQNAAMEVSVFALSVGGYVPNGWQHFTRVTLPNSSNGERQWRMNIYEVSSANSSQLTAFINTQAAFQVLLSSLPDYLRNARLATAGSTLTTTMGAAFLINDITSGGNQLAEALSITGLIAANFLVATAAYNAQYYPTLRQLTVRNTQALTQMHNWMEQFPNWDNHISSIDDNHQNSAFTQLGRAYSNLFLPRQQ